MFNPNIINLKIQNIYQDLPNYLFSIIKPEKIDNPEIILFNKNLAEKLDLDFRKLSLKQKANFFAGNLEIKGSNPIAMAYSGHQFGHFNNLGDGRAILIAQHIINSANNVFGINNSININLIDIQLKGCGKTPYSRNGDGKATLGSVLREYIMSEAIFALNIPTTRSLAIVATNQPVLREKIFPGAILTRVALSHIRIGTFQYVAAKNDVETIKKLADYSIKNYFPEIKEGEKIYLSFLQKVVENQAILIAKWLSVGFIHGVMNTDNMTISGETIDYGPCAFMDEYNPKTVFSSIDYYGRYRYENQPNIAKWNLARFAESMLPLLHRDISKSIKIAEDIIQSFDEIFNNHFTCLMSKKFGFKNKKEGDWQIIRKFLNFLEKNKLDYTNSLRDLTLNKDKLLQKIENQNSEFLSWYKMWQKRVDNNDCRKEEIFKMMNEINPAIIPRNHLVNNAIKEAEENNNLYLAKRLLLALKNPFTNSKKFDDYKNLPRDDEVVKQTFCGT